MLPQRDAARLATSSLTSAPPRHPAQLSGANRQAAFHNVLHHSRNRLVITFLDIVDLLKPRWGAGRGCWPDGMAAICACIWQPGWRLLLNLLVTCPLNPPSPPPSPPSPICLLAPSHLTPINHPTNQPINHPINQPSNQLSSPPPHPQVCADRAGEGGGHKERRCLPALCHRTPGGHGLPEPHRAAAGRRPRPTNGECTGAGAAMDVRADGAHSQRRCHKSYNAACYSCCCGTPK